MTEATLDPIDQSQALEGLLANHREYLEDRAVGVTQHNVMKLGFLILLVLCVALTGALIAVIARYANVEPLVIRVDELRGAEVVSYKAASTYKPRAPELEFHLQETMERYLSRHRDTLAREYPKALPYFKNYQAGKLDQRDTQKVLDTFRTTPNADDMDVKVKSVVLSELATQPFQAAITFERRAYYPGTQQLRGDVQVAIAQVTFEVLERAPTWLRQRNPLLIAITKVDIHETRQ